MILRTLLSLAAFSLLGVSQEPVRQILDLSDEDLMSFVHECIRKDFPPTEGDKFVHVLINRSHLVIPALEEAVRTGLSLDPQPERRIALAAELIAYAGDEAALRSISRLIQIDKERFRPLVARTLNHAKNWHNPFDLAYRANDLGDPEIWGETTRWIEDELSRSSGRRRWAESFSRRYEAQDLPSQWEKDPIVRALRRADSEDLRNEILRLATEDQRRKEQR